jgi:signal transduction histidine kinase
MTTSGSGAPQAADSGFQGVGGGGSFGDGPLGAGQGQAGPGAGGPGGQPALPVPVNPPPRRGDGDNLPSARGSVSGASSAVNRGSRFALRNWRVRWRLFAIIVVPTVAALIFGVIQSTDAVSSYESFSNVRSLANLNSLVVTGVGQLGTERDLIAGYVAAGKPASMKNQVLAAEQATNVTINEISSQSAGVVSNSAIRAQTILALQNGVLGGISDLNEIRNAALTTSYPSIAIIQVYDERLITPFITFSNDIAAGTGNSTLQSDVTVLNSLLLMEDDASLQRAYLYQALQSNPQDLTPEVLQDLQQADSTLSADNAQFLAAASVQESQDFNNTVSGPLVDEAKSEEERAEASAASGDGTGLTIGTQEGCASQSAAQCWWTDQTQEIDDMQGVINGTSAQPGLAAQITSQADSLASSARTSLISNTALSLLLLIVVILITVIVARSMIRPLRKLRADALEIAGTKLPDMVRRLSESEGGDDSVEIEPVGVTSTDEIGEVARAFDQVHREAVRLAADEAMLRGNLNAMFVNLSRRSQSLIERQLTLIDNLEQSEQDPDRLSSLFRLDHLATRMRRNSENLLVLAGHEGARKWSQPVPLVDVLRAAVSEIEQYERVVLNVQPGIQVIGQAVNDAVHLVAEIVENATTFSPEDTQVYVTGQPLTSGGVLLDITDNGVGISEQEMAHANWRLDNPPVVDVAVSRRMGLFVVGRLAARHGVRVRLRHAQSGGLTALIWLPESVAATETATPMGRLRKFEPDDYGPAPALSAPTRGAGAGGFGGQQSSFGLGPGAGGPGGPGGPGAGGPGAGGPGVGGLGAGGLGVGGPGAGGPGAGALAQGMPAASGPSTGGAGGAAARMTRLGGGPAGGAPFGGATTAGGGFAGNAGNTGAAPGFGSGDFGNDGNDSAPASGSSLPTRQPGGLQMRGAGAPGGVPDAGPTFARGGAGNGNRNGSGNFGVPETSSFGGGFSEAGSGRGGSSGGGFAGNGFGDVPVPGPGTGSGPAQVPGGTTPAIAGSDGSSVTVPPSVAPGQEARLPIFDSLESDWFRRSGTSSSSNSGSSAGAGVGVGTGASAGAAATAKSAAASESWNSPADEGWRAARVAASPNADEQTNAGLPKRVPRANLVPGSVSGGGEGGGTEQKTEAVPPVRSADQIRNRMASFQRGVREARAAAPQNEEP